jgi:hypothetical protein
MSRTPFDSFAKQLLEEFLSPFGEVDTTYEVPGESRFVDVLFIPTAHSTDATQASGLFGEIAATACLFEPFRNQPSWIEVRNCLLKLFLVQAETVRRARRDDERLLDAELPQLWILAPSASQSLLSSFGAKPSEH